MKILIVEDEVLLADSLKTALERKGFTVETAYDGETGKEYAELGVYDLLILDVMMPKLNGFDLARQVRRSRCATPILMLTAKSELEDRIEGLNAGADYYLTKPFDARELLACVGALLRRQGAERIKRDLQVIGNPLHQTLRSPLTVGTAASAVAEHDPRQGAAHKAGCAVLAGCPCQGMVTPTGVGG